MKYLFFAKLLLLTTTLWGQTGNFFLSHYVPPTGRFDNVCFDMEQDNRGVLYFATNAGIIAFDGSTWEVIRSRGAVYSLLVTNEGKMFWSGTTGFGTIERDDTGLDVIRYLKDSVNDVFQSVATSTEAVFINDESLFIVDLKTGNISTIASNAMLGTFSGLIGLFGAVYVTTDQGRTFRVNGKTLDAYDFNFPQPQNLISSSSLDEQHILLTDNNRVFRCDQSLKIREVALVDQAYADASVLVSIDWINSSMVALGTLRGGVMFVNPNTGKTVEIINYATGLPDNEVFSIRSDNNENVWVAHDYGFTRIAPYAPFRSFSHYPGLNGNLLCARSHKGTVYVGTSLGLFKLIKEDIYEDVVTYVETKPASTKPTRNTPEQPNAVQKPIDKEPEEIRKGGFLRFLRKRKSAETSSNQAMTPKETLKGVTARNAAGQAILRKEKHTQKILRSTRYSFQKIKGVDSKVTQLSEVDGKLFAAGLGGLYEVKELLAFPVLADPVRFAFAYKPEHLILASTYENELHAIKTVDNSLDLTDFFRTIDDQVNFIFEGFEGELWLVALDRVYRVDVKNGKIEKTQKVKLPNTNLDETVGMKWKNRILFANASGFYSFNREKGLIEPIDSLQKPRAYFATGGNIWYRDSHRWNVIGDINEQTNLQLLNLFTDLRFLSSDQTPENLWLVSRNNELFKFYGEKITPYQKGYAVFIKSITSGDKKVNVRDEIELGENDGPYSFHVVQPEYIGDQAVEYRYMLGGLTTEWSDWSTTNNLLDFPYLPPGKYKLHVQSKNILGQTTDMKPVPFQVLAPYWKRPWFYALEVFVFACLVMISYRLSTRYIVISRLLMLITIIMLIEFIQTVAGATFASKDSPVIDFFIQVIVALLILPVEAYLRKLMFRKIGTPELTIPRLKSNRLKRES